MGQTKKNYYLKKQEFFFTQKIINPAFREVDGTQHFPFIFTKDWAVPGEIDYWRT